MTKFTKIVAYQAFLNNIYENRRKNQLLLRCDQRDTKFYFRKGRTIFKILVN